MAPRRAGAAAPKAAAPTRMAFIYIPNGVIMQDWTPGATGTAFTLPYILEPLAPHQGNVCVLSGLAQDGANAHGDGGGDHARSVACFLTGVHPRKTEGADLQAGISVDQVAAQRAGAGTRLPSLELGCEQGSMTGNCDSGYSCAYSTNISWRSPTTPQGKEINPRLVFERLFGSGAEAAVAADQAKRLRRRKSILDAALDDATQLSRQLGPTDRRKVDAYLAAVRDVERRIERAEAKAAVPDYPKPAGVPQAHIDHLRIMYDLMALAFQADITRIATLMHGNGGSNRSYRWIGVPDGHHNLSHHEKDPEKIAKIRKIDRFNAEQFAYFVGKLKATPDGDGSLLDRCMIVYGCGISDGNWHTHHDLPIVLAGTGNGTLLGGRHVRYDKNTPLNNLYLGLLDRMDSSVDALGDSTGRLPYLDTLAPA